MTKETRKNRTRPRLPSGYTRMTRTDRSRERQQGFVLLPTKYAQYIDQDQIFKVELTDEGIFLRAVSSVEVEKAHDPVVQGIIAKWDKPGDAQ